MDQSNEPRSYVHLEYALGFKLDLSELRWPATRWDRFKERWFPGWAKLRWPVRYATVPDAMEHARRRMDEDLRASVKLCGRNDSPI
jgi:hypothetical protein